MSSIKIRTKRENDHTQIRMLIEHPMEHGRNKDPKTGDFIPAHYIQELIVKYNDTVIVSSNMAGGISKDPYFAFLLKGGGAGDKISVSWVDNLGNRDDAEHEIS